MSSVEDGYCWPLNPRQHREAETVAAQEARKAGDGSLAAPKSKRNTKSAVGSGERLDALAERFERRASHIYRSTTFGTEDQRQILTAVFDGIAEELRAEAAVAAGTQPRRNLNVPVSHSEVATGTNQHNEEGK